MRLAFPVLLAALAAAVPANARPSTVDSPAGEAARAAIAIARQTGTSIVIADSAVSRRRVPAIRGRMEPLEAVRRLASAAGGKAVRAGRAGWRIVAAPSPAPQRRAAATRRLSPTSPPPPPEPVEIVVVGSKREAMLGEYAGQFSLIEGAELEFGGVGGTERIARRVAAISSTHLGSGRNKLFIRGIADSSFTGPTQATVGQYLGDLRLSYNAPDPDLRLSDLERVEVLEGPQGTLYGAGSLGGIIRLVPNAPEPGVTAGQVIVGGALTQHGEPGADASAMLNLPLLSRDAGLRLNVDAASRGGYIDKPLLGEEDVNRTEILGGRAGIRVDLSPNWTVDVIGVAQSTDAADSQYADRKGRPLESSARVVEGSDADFRHGQFVLSGRLGDVRLRSTTGFSWQDLSERYDATLPDGPPRLFTQRNDTEMAANETRAWQPLEEGFGWLAGISLTRNRSTLTRSLGEGDMPQSVTGVTNTIEEATAYGEGSLRLMEGLIATAGARLTRSRLSGSGEDVAPQIAAALREVTGSRQETVFLPSASLLADVAPSTALYLRYQEGFRPGGLAIEGPFVRRFENDYTSTFELGARHGRSGAGPFDLSASISFTRWRDIQADYIDARGFPSTANIGDGTVWSASLSGGAEVMRGLRVEAGVVYNDSQVDEPDILALLMRTEPALPPALVDGEGDPAFAPLLRLTQVPNIADFAGRIGFDYSRPVGGSLELRANGWANYVGKSRLGIGPELGDLQGDYLDSGLTLRLGRRDFGVSLGITNLADVEGNRFALGTPFAIEREQVTPLRPRTVRLGLDAAF